MGREIPHIASLMADSIEEVLDSSEVIIVGNQSLEFETVLAQLRDDQTIIDLVRITERKVSSDMNYQGICW